MGRNIVAVILPTPLIDYGVTLPPDRLVVGFKSHRAGPISDLLRKHGALEVYAGGAEYFREAAVGLGELAPALAGIVAGMTTRRISSKRGLLQPRPGTATIEAVELAGSSDFTADIFRLRSGRIRDQDGLPVARSDGGGGEPPQTLGTGSMGGDGGPEKPVERFLEGRLPGRVRFGEKCNLEVRISVQVSTGASTSPIKAGVLPEGKTANVLLLLHAPDFRIVDGARDRTIAVPPSGNSDFAMWELQAERSGVLDLSVTAYSGGNPLGELPLQTSVDASVETGPSEEQSSAASFQKANRGKVTLEIRYDEANRVYRCNFISNAVHTEDLCSERLKNTPEVAIDDLIRQLNLVAQGKSQMNAATTREWLRGKGTQLWIEFIPEKLQELFWQERSNITKITVLSSGDPVPWELLYPAAPGEAPDENTGFLGEAFGLTRWRFGKVAVDHLNNGRVCFVLPNGAPKEAMAEVDNLKQIVGGNSVTVGNLNELRPVLKSREFGILHFACHNRFQLAQPPTGSRIDMSDGFFEPSTLVNFRNKFDRPFVFMNACRTDGVAPSYTRLTGWAGSFLDTGAGAFVGSLWEVRDKSAAQFASTFYQHLRNETLGDAMRAARESISSIGGDPTWLAYSTYGDANASIAK